MRSLDATHSTPLGLFDDLLAGLAAEGQVLVDHGDDISARRLRAAMASLSRGLALRARQTTGRALRPVGFDPTGEVVVFAWLKWPDKATADAAWAKMMEDPRMKDMDMPFDGKRMMWGGFETIFQS